MKSLKAELAQRAAMPCIIDVAIVDMTRRLAALKIVMEKMQSNTQDSLYMTMIT